MEAVLGLACGDGWTLGLNLRDSSCILEKGKS